MTSWYQPLQRQDDKRWDMTVSNTSRTRVHAVGYCTGWPREYDDPAKFAHVGIPIELIEKEREHYLPFKEHFHTDGHATAEEAQACYRKYKLDTALAFRDHELSQNKCAECGVWTTGYGMLSRGLFPNVIALCPAHQTREFYERHYTK